MGTVAMALVAAHAIGWPLLAGLSASALYEALRLRRAAPVPGATVFAVAIGWLATMVGAALVTAFAVAAGLAHVIVFIAVVAFWGIGGATLTILLRTALRRVQKEQGRQEELEEMEQVKTDLINQVAHGLYTPLMPVRIHLHLLETDLGKSATTRQSESIRVMDRNLGRLTRIVEQVVLASQLQTDRLKLNIVKGRLDTIVRQAVQTAREEAFEGAPGIDVDMEPLEVNVDPDQLKLVLRSTLEEAMRRTQSNGRVQISARMRGGEALVQVTDGGNLDGDTDRMFDRFSNIHEREPGTEHELGLGLYVGRGIVERLGGRFWLERSDDGRGRIVSMALPAWGQASGPRPMPGVK